MRPAFLYGSLPNPEQEKQIKFTKNMVCSEYQNLEKVHKQSNPTFYIQCSPISERSLLSARFAGLARFSFKQEQHVNEWMSVKHWWNDTERGKTTYSEKNLFQDHFVHHKFHSYWTGIEIGPPGWETGSQPPARLLSECKSNLNSFKDSVRTAQYTFRLGNIKPINYSSKAMLGESVVE